MFKEGFGRGDLHIEPDLFRQTTINQGEETADAEKGQETMFKQTVYPTQSTEYKQIDTSKARNRKIAQIIIYYSDNTFEIFNPNPEGVKL